MRTAAVDRASWERVATLFDELVDLPEGERQALIEALARDAPDVARAVTKLLAADTGTADLLDSPLALAPLAGNAAAEEVDEPTPPRAGAYRIVGRLGRGGMAEVFAGERDDGVFEQRVAIKVLRRGLDTDDLLARFARERAILARLEHPAISRLLDAGALADGRPYLVMERVDGQPIDRYAEARALPLEARLRLLLVACDAVAFAHRNLVVHRDLKPSNVLVSAAGEVKLLDFGIAKLLTPDEPPLAEPTLREHRALTPAYAAPEQRAGAATTTATDVWGLGALAFELLVGEPPFASPALRGSKASAPPTPPKPSARVLERAGRGAEARRAASRLAGDLDLVLGKALRLDPAERYSSAEAFADDLRRHLAGRPVLARPASLGYRAGKFVRRHRGGVAASVLVVISLILGGGIAAWQARAAARERARPLPAVRHLTYSGLDAAPAASPDGHAVAFRSLRDGRSRIWIADLESGDERPLTDGPDHHPRFSPDGRAILFARSDDGTSALHVVPRAGGAATRLYEDALFGDFSPAKAEIVFARQSGGKDGRGGVETILFVGPSAGGETRELVRLEGRALQPPRYSPDGRTIAVTASSLGIGERAAVALVDATSGRIRSQPVAGSSPRGLAWSRSARLVYSQPDTVLGWITGESAHLVAHDLSGVSAGTGSGGASTRSVLKSPTSISALDVVDEGRVVFASGSFQVNLREIALDDGESVADRRWLTRGESSDRQPGYSRDGRSIVFSSNRGGNLDLWTLTLATGAARRVTHDPAFDWDPTFTADGRLLWSSNRGGSFEIWSAAADGSSAVQLTRDGVDAENPTTTPDGDWIVYVSRNPAHPGIHRMRADGSESSRIVAGELFLPELSPDGRFVAYLDLGGERPTLRVASTDGSARLQFELELPRSDAGDDPDLGRCRWFPDGRSLAVLGRDVDGAYVVERHDLPSTAGARSAPPVRLARETGYAAESFGISPDGRHLVVAFWDSATNLMLADNVPGLGR